MKEAASYISSSKEQATRAVAPLVDKGLMERYTDSANRNYVHIQLTETGRMLVLKMLDSLYDNVNELLWIKRAGEPLNFTEYQFLQLLYHHFDKADELDGVI